MGTSKSVFNGILRSKAKLDHYAHRAFKIKQGQDETVSQWGVRMDTECGIYSVLRVNMLRISRGQMKTRR
jgi:hypothetical protein